MRIYVRTPNGRVPNFPDKYFSELLYSVRRHLTPLLMRKKFPSVKVLGADNIVTRFFFEFVSFSWSLIFKGVKGVQSFDEPQSIFWTLSYRTGN